MKVNDLKNKIVVLSTVNQDKPHSIAVEINEIIDDKILITNNQMNFTPKYLSKNPNVCLVYWNNDNGIRIEGTAEYFESGKLFDRVKNLPENRGFKPRGVILIKISKIINLG